MLSKILSATLMGIDAHIVDVEVDITSKGLPHFSTVGLPDAAVKESKDRVRIALKHTGFNFPLKQITINLAPADIRKEESADQNIIYCFHYSCYHNNTKILLLT